MNLENYLSSGDKARIIQEIVPGKQITLAHIIANPDKVLYYKSGAIGILTLSPSETAIIAGDVAMKASGVELGFVDRFSGTVIVTGSVSQVEAALVAVMEYSQNKLKFDVCELTRT